MRPSPGMRLSHLRILFWLVLFLALGEIGLEARASLRGFDTHLFGDASPLPSESNGSFGPTDSFPFRSPLFEEDATGIRIWFGSSSYAEDTAHPPETVFPNRTARYLADLLGRDVLALNRSQAGYTIETNLTLLADDAGRWKPDAALLYQLTNDLHELSSSSFAGVPVAPARGPDGFDRLTATLGRLYEETTLFAQLRGNVTPYFTQRRLLAEDLPQGADAEFRDRVERFVDTARAAGITPVLVTLAYRGAPNGVITPELRRSTLRWAPDISTEAYFASLDSWNSVIRMVAADRGVALIDLQVSMQDRLDLFRDMTHFTAEGHEQVALILAAELAGLVELDE